jgi:hypothetical protein
LRRRWQPLLLASGAALAEEKLDQENDRLESTAYHEDFNSDRQHLAQVFTAGKSGQLSKVSVLIDKDRCGDGASDPRYKDIEVRLYTVGHYGWSGGSVSTTIPASQVPYRPTCEPFWPTQWTDVTFAPGNRPSVVAGRKYALALEPEVVPFYDYGHPTYRWYHNSAYGEGDGHHSDVHGAYAGEWSYYGIDFLFRTYVDVPDTDGDGLANDVDQCRYEAGPASNNGCPTDIVGPSGSVQIDGDARRTRTRAVTLDLAATDPNPSSGLSSMRLKNGGGSWTAWQPYAESKDWKLTRGAGKKTVYAQYRDAAGNPSATTSDSITYRP